MDSFICVWAKGNFYSMKLDYHIPFILCICFNMMLFLYLNNELHHVQQLQLETSIFLQNQINSVSYERTRPFLNKYTSSVLRDFQTNQQNILDILDQHEILIKTLSLCFKHKNDTSMLDLDGWNINNKKAFKKTRFFNVMFVFSVKTKDTRKKWKKEKHVKPYWFMVPFQRSLVY